MRRALALLALSLTGCGLGGPAHSPPAANVAGVVDMGFSSFTPASITVHAGDTVEWRNKSLITHSVTDDPYRAEASGDAALPAGAEAFDSGDIPAGQIFLRKFTTPGTYRYFCTHHESDGMIGTIVVTAAE